MKIDLKNDRWESLKKNGFQMGFLTLKHSIQLKMLKKLKWNNGILRPLKELISNVSRQLLKPILEVILIKIKKIYYKTFSDF